MAVAKGEIMFLCYCCFCDMWLIMIELKTLLGCDTQLFKS